jgi:hypothetical protein
MKNRKLHILKFTAFLFFFLFFGSNTANAATLNFSPSSGNFTVGNIFTVNILINTQSVSINNAEVVVNFPKDLLEVVSTSKSGSIFSLWVEEPNFSNSSGTLSFNGGVPTPGYTGSAGRALSVVFRVKKIGSASVVFSSASVRANDGLGTDVLTSKNQANFDLSKAIEKVPTPTTTAKPVTEGPKAAPSIKIEELKKTNEIDSSAKFLVTSVGKKEKSSYKIEIDGLESVWENQESGIYETGPLPKGTHRIVVSMDTVDKDTISNSLSFVISGSVIPTFTEYSENIREKDFIVIKGLADPNIDIVVSTRAVITSTGEILVQETTIKSDAKGLFAYVSDRAGAGVYNITAYSRAKNGFESDKTPAIVINVLPKSLPILTTIINTFSLLIPLLALILLVIIMAIWGWYKVLHYREILRKKLAKTEAITSKSFGILDEDIKEEIRIFKKIKALQPLTTEERTYVNQLKKDLEGAERTILEEMSEIKRI